MVSSTDPPIGNGMGGQHYLRPDPEKWSATAATMPIAIVGMSCRFPGDATSPEKLWKLCADGRSAWSQIPSERFNMESFYHPQETNSGTSNVRGGHFLAEDVALFDATFFNFSAEVASSLDPQYRLQLESTFEALESAGMSLSQIAGSHTSVYAGAFFRDYHDSLMRDPETLPRYFMTGNGAAMISNRISHFFDLRGASMTVDTGCSTTLTALHLACQDLRSGLSKLSIVGGASVMINPNMFISMSNLGLLGPDGRSYSFDSRGVGYGRGEGVATLVVKPLEDALRDGDPIRAVIRETALNQDGKTPTITSPSQDAQEELIRMCYRNAGLDTLHTSYIEAHGTGTRTGDPIEAKAIGAVFGKDRSTQKPLYIGSVKSNIGHLEAASGLAAVIKVVLALENGQVPPSINFDQPNPNLHLEALKLKVPTQLESWPSSAVRRASISNFGYGGSNAHVIVDDSKHYYERKSLAKVNGFRKNGSLEASDSMKIVVLSAKDEGATRAMIANLREYLSTRQDEQPVNFHDLAYTLGQRRSTFPWSIALPAQTVSDLIDQLGDSRLKLNQALGRPRLGFVFTGQGAQWHAMGRELIKAYPVFEKSIHEAGRCLKDLGASWSLYDELMRDESTSRVNTAEMSLPLCCAVQISLVNLLRSWGINPTAVTGHSSGEVGAAYAARAISVRQALAIVYIRGVRTQDLVQRARMKGGMLAVGLGAELVAPYIANITAGKAVVACVNSASSVTVSGDMDAIDELEARLRSDKVFTRKLKVAAAYHSHHMQPLADDYFSILTDELNKLGNISGVLYSSPVTGGWIDQAEALDAEHWVKNMIQPVLFAHSLRNMCFGSLPAEPDNLKTNVDAIVEIGPHSALAGPIRQILSASELQGHNISYGSCLTRGRDAVRTMQELACSLLGRGYPVDIAAINFPRDGHEPNVIYDLPSYPWNHSIRHWVESRLNKTYRQRKHATHHLLGTLVNGTNPLTPTWRHIIRPSEIPWVRDHMVGSDMIYPGAGCIAMAIEAVQQLYQSTERVIRGFKLRNIEIIKALIIPDTSNGIEVQLSLHDCSDKSLDPQDWKEFRVFSAEESGTWSEHCKGLIAASFDSSTKSDLNRGFLKEKSIARSGPLVKPMVHGRRVEVKEFFKSLQSIGINHGPSFQNLTSIQSSRNQSQTTFAVADSASLMPSRYEQPHVLHPITLDALFQAAYSTLSPTDQKVMGTAIPRSIEYLFVSSEISHDPGHLFQAFTTLHSNNAQGFDVSMAARDEGNEVALPAIEVHRMHYQSLGQSLPGETDTDDSRMCLAVHWERDLTTMTPEILEASLKMTADSAELAIIEDLKRATYYIIDSILASLTDEDKRAMDWHHKILYGWMEAQKRRAANNELSLRSSRWETASEGVRQHLLDKVASKSVDGEMLCRIGKNLLSILRKEIAPLELMLEDKLLYSYYEKALRVNRSLDQVKRLVKLYGHKNPRARILEIGAGTGACTTAVLESLGEGGSSENIRFSHYDFTDISSGFFETARDKFSAWGDLIAYRKLNIEEDPVDQSFELDSYDLIIACQVLHATKNMNRTLKNVRQLLKTNGKLVLVETTQDALDVQLIFGTLPGWWLSEEPERKHSPNLTIDAWGQVLQRTEFSGLDVQVRDCEDDLGHAMRVIMSTAVKPLSPEFRSETVVLYGDSQPDKAWLDTLRLSIAAATSSTVTVESLTGATLSGKVVIFLDTTESILRRLDAGRFNALSENLLGAEGVLWLSRGGAINCENPFSSLHTGLLRTLRLERAAKRYVSLDLDPIHELWSDTAIKAILDVFRHTFDYSQDWSMMDIEYAERDSSIYIPRVHPDPVQEATLLDDHADSILETNPFRQPGRELQMDVRAPGSLDSLYFKDDPSAGLPLPNDFVEIEPQAFGLNFRDIMVAMGQLQEKIMGFECSGTVTRVGPNPTHDFQPGDRVCALTTTGHWSNFIRIHYTGVGRIPSSMSFETAASIPMVFVTAYYSLVEVARLQKDETVLIHAAAGGVGQAAIIVAQYIGAEIYVTVGSREKHDFLVETYGIPSDHIFSSRDSSFHAELMAMTKGRGVDVLLNSLAGVLLQESWKCVATLGRFVEIGKRDIQLNKNLEMEPFGRGTSFFAIDLIHLGKFKGPVLSQVLYAVLDLLKRQLIKPIGPITIYPISEIEKAFRLMQGGKHRGKIVVKPNPDDLVKTLPRKLSAKFSSKASYLVVGGLGGIGKSIAQWIIQEGGKNLILLSRNAASYETSQALSKELEADGNTVTIMNCDIANRSELARVLDECTRNMPPVRGVIQAAMVLEDSVFDNMSFTSWERAVRPKVQGSWNLHELLPNLDFFVMLSSLTGVLGNPSQANYAAGNTFQDALARYRSAQGLPAVSIDLGMVKSVGYVAETKGVAERLIRLGYRPLEEHEVLQLIGTAIMVPVRELHASQLITGIASFDTIDGVSWRAEQRFQGLQRIRKLASANDGGGSKKKSLDFKDTLAKALSWAEIIDLIVDAITNKLSEMFMIPASEIDQATSVTKYGVDSLVAVELRNWILLRTHADITIFDVLQSVSLSALAVQVAKKSRFVAETKLAPPQGNS